MIQSQPSFKLIISFTFASVMFKISDRNNLTSFEKFAAEKCFGMAHHSSCCGAPAELMVLGRLKVCEKCFGLVLHSSTAASHHLPDTSPLRRKGSWYWHCLDHS